MEYSKLKMQDSYSIIQNNHTCVLSMCNNGVPFCVPLCYETDCFCGNLKLYLEACRCGQGMENIYDGQTVCILITTRNCNYTNSVMLEGTINVVPEDVDCCCNPINECHLTLEFTPCNVVGRRYRCNR